MWVHENERMPPELRDLDPTHPDVKAWRIEDYRQQNPPMSRKESLSAYAHMFALLAMVLGGIAALYAFWASPLGAATYAVVFGPIGLVYLVYAGIRQLLDPE